MCSILNLISLDKAWFVETDRDTGKLTHLAQLDGFLLCWSAEQLLCWLHRLRLPLWVPSLALTAQYRSEEIECEQAQILTSHPCLFWPKHKKAVLLPTTVTIRCRFSLCLCSFHTTSQKMTYDSKPHKRDLHNDCRLITELLTAISHNVSST